MSTAQHVLGLIGDPSPRASRLLRFLRRTIDFLGRRVLRFRLELVGEENLPRDASGRVLGGWIAAGLPHVTWIEPFVMLVLLPPEPGSREELRLARLVTERLAERIGRAVAEMYPGTVDPPEAPRPWRWLRRLF